jgi:hypothetical protein
LTGKYRPPAIPVIPEETEKDEEFKNFRLVPWTGKCQPPTMTAISEETDGDLLGKLEQEQYSNVLCDSFGTTTLETYKLMGDPFLEDQQATVEPV